MTGGGIAVGLHRAIKQRPSRLLKKFSLEVVYRDSLR
jgi:hypothetical protein